MKKYLDLNAQLNLLDENGNLQVEKDKEAAREYFVGPGGVNENTVFFHTLQEKLDYLVENGYYDEDVLSAYTQGQIKEIYQQAYAYKFRFDSFVGAHKFYTQYALKTYDGARYLERFEDRVAITALALARGDFDLALRLVDVIITGQYQPATPTFLNAGRKDAGDMVSCFLLRVEDSMESIGRAINSSLQLSKRGGGVALLLTNLREAGAPIKNVEDRSSGVIPVMKILEDSFSYANQLGSRQGAGAVYLNAHHPDILKFLDTKRENADEKIRIKTLSLGVVIPDITFELARKDEPMYLFSPYDVERVTGKAMSDVSVTDNYYDWVEDSRIRKTKISARELFQTIAEIQFESGYPYLLFEDTANKANPFPDRINMSNLCSEILQPNTPSVLSADLGYEVVGKDISCNLGSLNIAKVMEHPGEFGWVIDTAVRALTGVVHQTDIQAVPSIAKANKQSRSIGLGQMNLHGYLAQQGIEYGSPEALEFVDVYFAAVRFYALATSMEMARDTGSPFEGFEETGYADGSFLESYTSEEYLQTLSPKVQELLEGLDLPDRYDWDWLSDMIREYGLYHSHLLAVPPTGSISYVNGATPSIHPVTAPVEIRKEGKMGRVYYPAPGLSEETLPYYQDAYSIGYEKLIDTYAVATKHTDQGLSCTLFITDEFTTRDLNKAYIYAWRKGLKTLYYTRVRQAALEGTEVDGCVSCTL